MLGVDHPGFQGEIVAELERPVGELPAARREAVECVRGDLGERGAHERAGDDVAGVVDAGVYARVGNQGGESAQGDRRRREHVTDAGREREGSGGVPGGERGRRRHAHLAGEGNLFCRAVGAPAVAEWLDGEIDDAGRDRDRGEAVRGGASSSAAPGRGEDRGRGDRQAGVVGGVGEPGHGAVEGGGRGLRDRRVEGDVDPLGVLQPPGGSRRWGGGVGRRGGPRKGDPMSVRRAAAIGALLLGLGGFALAVVVAVQEFPRGLIALACVTLAAAAAWYGVLRRGVLRVVGLSVGVLGLGAAIVLLLSDRLLEQALVVGALVLSGACAGAAFGVRVQLPQVAAPRRPVLFFNPKSGGGKAERFSVAAEARARGIEPIEFGPPWDLERLVRDAVARGADGLAMAGGDGSQAVVAAIAAELDLPYACVPAGTRNHFALDLGVDRDDVVGALDAFVDGGEHRVDLADVNGRVFVNNVSLGLYADAVQRKGYRDAKLRTLLDTVPEVLGPEGSGLDLRWTGPDGHEHRSGAAILVSNNRYRLGRAVGSGTRPRIDDGLPRDHGRRRPDRPRQRQAACRSDRGGSGPHRPSRSIPTTPCPPASTAKRRCWSRPCASASIPTSCARASRASTPAPRRRPCCPRAWGPPSVRWPGSPPGATQ